MGRSSFNDSNRAVFDVGQNMQDFGRQWERVGQTVAACSQYDNLQSLSGEILLETHVAVHCDEHLKASFLGFFLARSLSGSRPIPVVQLILLRAQAGLYSNASLSFHLRECAFTDAPEHGL